MARLSWLAIAIALIAMHEARGDLTKVAVIDTGLDLTDERFAGKLCASGHKDFTGRGISDMHGHGTHVAGLIKQYAGSAAYCLLILKYYEESASSEMNARRVAEATEWAVSQGAKLVNISGGGPGFNEREYLAIRSSPGTTWVVAAGNDAHSLDDRAYKYYPASYELPNMVSVGALDASGSKRLDSSNYGRAVGAWEIGEGVRSTFPHGRSGTLSGSSMATAIRSGRLISRGSDKGYLGRVAP